MTNRQKQNYLITQLVKGVPLDKIDTHPDDTSKAIAEAERIIRDNEANFT